MLIFYRPFPSVLNAMESIQPLLSTPSLEFTINLKGHKNCRISQELLPTCMICLCFVQRSTAPPWSPSIRLWPTSRRARAWSWTATPLEIPLPGSLGPEPAASSPLITRSKKNKCKAVTEAPEFDPQWRTCTFYLCKMLLSFPFL